MQGYSFPNIETRCIYEILFRWRHPLMSETLLIVCSGKNWFTRGRKDGCILLLTDERGCCTQPEKEHVQLTNQGSLHVLNQKKKKSPPLTLQGICFPSLPILASLFTIQAGHKTYFPKLGNQKKSRVILWFEKSVLDLHKSLFRSPL